MPEAAPQPVPEGMSTVTPHLWFGGDCASAIDFYQQALGATVIGEPVPAPDGTSIWHVMLQIGDSKVMMADAQRGAWEGAPSGGTSVGFFTYVDDCDAWFERAVAAGCEVIDPLEDMFWGDRTGKVKDPFGHTWAFATHKWIFSEEEMAAQMGG